MSLVVALDLRSASPNVELTALIIFPVFNKISKLLDFVMLLHAAILPLGFAQN